VKKSSATKATDFLRTDAGKNGGPKESHRSKASKAAKDNITVDRVSGGTSARNVNGEGASGVA